MGKKIDCLKHPVHLGTVLLKDELPRSQRWQAGTVVTASLYNKKPQQPCAHD